MMNNTTMATDRKYIEYRLNKIGATIEFVGGFNMLSSNEKEEYKRLRAYLTALNASNNK